MTEYSRKQNDIFTMMKKEFFIKSMILYLLPLFIPILLICSIAIFMLDNYVRSEIDRRNNESLVNYAGDIDNMINELEKINIILSTNSVVKLKLKSVLNGINENKGISPDDYEIVNTIIDLLYSSLGFNPHIASMYIYFNNDTGWFLSSSNRFSNLDFFYDTDWISNYENNKSSPLQYWIQLRTINDFMFRENENVDVLTIYQKIYSSGKTEPDGILVMNILEDSLNKELSLMLNRSDEYLLVLDHNGNILFKNNKSIPDDFKGYKRYETSSKMYQWQYIYYTPVKVTYQVPILLRNIIIIVCISSTMTGLAIAYATVLKNYKQFMGLVNIIKQAKEGKNIKFDEYRKNDLFSYIMYNTVKSFIQIDYLQVQLSERKYHAEILELKALQYQLNPHFLYNTMQTILWKTIALTHGPNDASKMIEELSDILHYSLDEDDKLVSIFSEIKFTKSYIDIQKARYKNQFDVSWELSDINEKSRIPKLILQPIIENSIYHGVRNKNSTSLIRINICNKGENIKIKVIDNGIGMDKETLKNVRKKLCGKKLESSSHIGLSNTNKRLQLLYGNKSLLNINSRQQKGTIVTINIPQMAE